MTEVSSSSAPETETAVEDEVASGFALASEAAATDAAATESAAAEARVLAFEDFGEEEKESPDSPFFTGERGGRVGEGDSSMRSGGGVEGGEGDGDEAVADVVARVAATSSTADDDEVFG